ncbi:MAG: DUF2177 family protein [Anaerosomatales bacterium]|nr:DUF2177 family protein [Anaerosomatales bacterium]
MTLGKALIVYGASLIAFLGIDAVWLTTMSDRFYRKQLGDLMRDDPDLGVALAFYLLYVAGVLLLVVLPAAEKGSLLQAVGFGALLGVVAYGTYDITNLATVRDWPVVVTAVDLVWGGTLTGAVSAVGYLVARWVA